MKLPARLLGLLVTSAAVTGCFGAVDEPTQTSDSTEQAQTKSEEAPETEVPATPGASTPTPTPAEDAGAAPSTPEDPPAEDPCPPCGMG